MQFICLREGANFTEHVTNILLLIQNVAAVFTLQHEYEHEGLFVIAFLAFTVYTTRMLSRMLPQMSRHTHSKLKTMIRQQSDGTLCLPYVSPATSCRTQSDDERSFNGVPCTPSIVSLCTPVVDMNILHERIVHDAARARFQMVWYRRSSLLAEILVADGVCQRMYNAHPIRKTHNMCNLLYHNRRCPDGVCNILTPREHRVLPQTPVLVGLHHQVQSVLADVRCALVISSGIVACQLLALQPSTATRSRPLHHVPARTSTAPTISSN